MILQGEIDEELWDTIHIHYENGDYTGALRDAFLFLSNLLRNKADLSGDGVELINKAFSDSNPKIKISRMESTSEIDEQKGIANILRGMYQFIRNPRSHEKVEDNEKDCISIILFIDYLLKKLRGSKGQYEISVFLEQVIDERFVQSKEYCDALVNEIPERKFFDTVLEVYKARESININNIEPLFKSLFVRFKKSTMDTFLKTVADDLRRTTNDNDIKYIVKILPIEMWNQIDSIARIRTESRIIKSIKEEHYLATWCTSLFPYFSNREGLLNAFSELITSDSVQKCEYFYKHMFPKAIRLLTENDLYEDGVEKSPYKLDATFIYYIRKKIEKGSKINYSNIKEYKYFIPQFITNYLEKAMKEYQEAIEEPTKIDYYDEIPF